MEIRRATAGILIGAAVFLGSALAFAVQPMLSRVLLGAFGGSAAVWAVCLATFQMLLLAGYGYAHLLGGRAFRRQAWLHVALLAGVAVWLALRMRTTGAILALPGWQALPPALGVLFLLAGSCGPAFVLLTAGSSLLQAWAARVWPHHGVYRLYGLSSAGSLLGLLTYPFLLEPAVTLTHQLGGWCALFGVYAGLVAALAWLLPRTIAPGAATAEAPVPAPATDLPTRRHLWYVLPGVSSFLLVALTNALTLDAPPLPAVWVVLLAAFLLSYTLGFSNGVARAPRPWAAAALVAGLALAWQLRHSGSASFLLVVALGVIFLLLAGMFLHGWLYAIRPPPARLTAYYLAIAAGGAAGGLLGSFVAPVIFLDVFERDIGLALFATLTVMAAASDPRPRLRARVLFGTTATLAVGLLVLVCALTAERFQQPTLALRRNFHGILHVWYAPLRLDGEVVELRALTHGVTLHGNQLTGTARRRTATTYFSRHAGIGLLLTAPGWTNRPPQRVGIIGLGVGSLAAYGRPGDTYRFYEINPQIVALATGTNYFSYLADSRARIEVRVGDARRVLEREVADPAEPPLDLLVVDAYSGDSVPLHLATREAFALYRRRLAPGGLLAVHVTNNYLDLLPLIKTLGREWGVPRRGIVSAAYPDDLATPATWCLLGAQACDPLDLMRGGRLPDRIVNWNAVRDVPLPTDECGSLLHLFAFRRLWRDSVQTLLHGNRPQQGF